MSDLVTAQPEVMEIATTPEVVAIADQFDPFDSVATITFGRESLEKITAFSDSILEQVRVRDSGEAGDILHALSLKHI